MCMIKDVSEPSRTFLRVGQMTKWVNSAPSNTAGSAATARPADGVQGRPGCTCGCMCCVDDPLKSSLICHRTAPVPGCSAAC